MPHKKPIVQYSDGQFQFKVPFIMYADFESILEPIHGPENNPRISSTRGINNHVPSGWCLCSEFAYGKVENPLTLFKPGFFGFLRQGGGFHPPPENNVTVELGQ